MKDFVKSLGGAGWAAFLGLSAIVTVVAAFRLPAYVDTTNPWVLLGAGAILFPIAFANGWKQRGFRNERDLRLAEELEKERQADKEKNEAVIAQIKADKELKLERLRQKHEIALARSRDEADIEIQRIAEEGRAQRERDRAEREREERDRETDPRQFSLPQLKYMLQARCEESVGACGLRTDNDDPVAQSLVDADVFIMESVNFDFEKAHYILTPRFRIMLAEREDEVRALLGAGDVG